MSTTMRLVSTGMARNEHAVTTPVRPMPPAVAQNASAPSSAGPRCAPRRRAGRGRRRRRGPSTSRRRWWFLPWTSAATAPPTVTWRVPGVTGTNQPRGTRNAQQLVEGGAGAGGHDAGGGVEHRARGASPPSWSTHDAAGVLGGVAIGAAEAAGEHAARPAESARHRAQRRRRGTTVAAVGAVRPHPVQQRRRQAR